MRAAVGSARWQRAALLAGVSAAVLLCAAPTAAQTTKRWDGSQSDNWFAPQNWTSAFVPTATDNALINNLLSAPVGPTIRSAGAVAATVAVNDLSLEVTTGGTLTVGNSLFIGAGGTFTAHNGAIVNVNGVPDRLRVEDGGTATIDNATLTTAGDVLISFSGTTPGSLLAVVNGAVVTVAGGAGTVFVGGTADGTLAIGQGGSAGMLNAATVDLRSAGSRVVFQHTGTTTFAPDITNLGQVEVIGPGTTILTGANTYAGGTTITGGTLQIGAGGTTGTLGTGAVTNNATLAFNRSDTLIVASAISGTGAVSQIGAGTTILTGTNTYAGVTTIAAGTLQIGNGGTTGTLGTGAVTNNATLAFNRSDTLIVASAISGTGVLNQIGGGTTILTGINTYTGATTVNAGTLIVNGSIADSSGLVAAAGTVIGGTGILPSATINGTLAPGNSVGTITVNGNLSFGNNAVYLVELGATADKTVVTGTADLAGTVTAAFAPGASLAHQYTILAAAGGITGTFDTLNATGVPAGFAASLGYTPTDVTLTLTAQLQQQLLSFGGNRNQQVVAGAIDTGFNSGNALPPPFLNLFGLSGPALGNALTQLSGEVGTGAAGAGFQGTSQFLSLMLDPFLGVQFTDGTAQPRAIGFAPERVADLPKEILAFGPNGKINPARLVDRSWGVWGTAYGATARFYGDPTIGSSRLTATTGGFAAGIDYKLSPDSVIGVAIAGGALNYGLDLGGNGKGDTVQAGVYGTQKLGASYIAAALAVAHHDLSTDRTAAFAGISDHLTADFTARSVGARIEAGHRFTSIPSIGFTPYGALQAQWFRTSGYSERDALAGGFALVYDPQTTEETRSEIGARLDSRLALANDSTLILRARGAWAHEFNVDRSIQAVFQSLPGAGFTVIGAEPARDAALVSGGAELKLANGVTIGGKLDGEFARATRAWGGSGTIRVVW
jgi:autotransporter-associated beta strand protein